jgi:ABC-2 type transport system ATP-binding protein
VDWRGDAAEDRCRSSFALVSATLMPPIIEAIAVTKSFRHAKRFPGLSGAVRSLFTREFTEIVAVNDVSFGIASGEAVGYLGPNGAGKSTMIKMLAGILLPSRGSVRVLERIPHLERRKNAREIGVVFGQRSQLWWDLPVRDSFELHRRIYQISVERYRTNLARFSELLALGAFIDRPVRQLSLGQRMRAEMVMALLHDPKILFLDEPTIGLDIVAKDSVRTFLRQVNIEQGVTVILTTHDLQDIEQICPRLILVHEAQLLFDGALTQLRSALGSQRRLRLEFTCDPGPVELPYARLVSDAGPLKHYLVEREDVSLVQVLSDLRDRAELKDLSLEEPGIEELIRGVYTTNPRARQGAG